MESFKNWLADYLGVVVGVSVTIIIVGGVLGSLWWTPWCFPGSIILAAGAVVAIIKMSD